MADKEAGYIVYVDAENVKGAGKKAVKGIAKEIEVETGKKKLQVPVDISVDISDTNDKIKSAQSKVVKSIEKMTAEGFSASSDDIKNLKKELTALGDAMDKGKIGRQNGIYKIISQQVNDIEKAYQQLQKENRKLDTKIKSTTNRPRKKKDKYNPEFKVEKGEIEARKKQHATEIQNRELAGRGPNRLGSTNPREYPITSIDLGKTTDQMMRLSEYSAHGSNWANVLAHTLAEEVEKSAETLVKRIEKNYEIGTDNKIHSKKDGRITTEQQFLNDVIKDAKKQLKTLIKESEKGNEDITLDMLKEEAAIIKVLTKTLGKTTEDAEKKIISAIEGRYTETTEVKQGKGKYQYDKSTLSKLGSTGLEEGEQKGVGPGHENTQKLVAQLYKAMKKWDAEVIADRIAKEMMTGTEKIKKAVIKDYKSTKGSQADRKIDDLKLSENFENELNKLNGTVEKTQKSVDNNRVVAEAGITNDRIENSAERVADRAEAKKNDQLIKNAETDLSTGFNTDTNSDTVISILRQILKEVKSVVKVNSTGKQISETALVVANPLMQKAMGMIEDVKNQLPEVSPSGKLPRSNIYTSLKDPANWLVRLKETFAKLTGTTAKYEKILASTSKEQDELAAKRVQEAGLGKSRNVTGDRINIARRMNLWRNKEDLEKVFKNLKISEGIEIDTTKVTEKLGTLLSGKAMRNAQMGGSPLRNIIGYGTAFIGMPSLEKSRAAAEALSQINANIRDAMSKTLADIQDKESELAGLEEKGDLKLGPNNEVLESSTPEAKALAAELESCKIILDTILADMGMVNTAVDKSHGNIRKVLKQLNFTSSVLRDNNSIVYNINAGYDKNGKSLKFQTRTAEILNYTFQLMSRHIGQVLKSWVLMLNPINIIKKSISYFNGYSTKWQRTMSVIKYNIHSILEPFMDKVAQFLVNCIGFVDIISQKVQKAYGMMPISLFDQAAADSRKIHEELEAATSVSAGFDELHDIGSDSSGANDLLGEIYKPQLSKEWEDLANKIGDLFAGVITGDMGFSEVMKKILEILVEGLKLIAKTIWDWFKQTAIGKYITTHWKDILKTLLSIFIGWQLLKIAGKLLWNALFGNFTESAIGGLLNKVGNWIISGLKWVGTGLWNLLGLTTFGQQMQVGFLQAFQGQGLIGAIKGGGASLGSIFAQAFLAVAGVTIAVKGISYFGNKADRNSAYNLGLKEAGGDDKDKKSNFGNGIGAALTGAAGGALTGLAIGGPLGAAIGAGIGAIAGTVRTVLSPTLEEAEIAARNMNNELQKIEYYEGKVQGAQTAVDSLDEMMNILNSTLDAQTQKVFDQGEKLGISETRMRALVKATQDGTYHTGMLSGKEIELSDNLNQLMWTQSHVEETTDKLTKAKRKLEKAEMDLAIAQDIEAGNYELAAARIELALASEVYDQGEATKKMIALTKEADDGMRANLLNDMSPELKKEWEKYVTTTDQGKKDLAKIYSEMNEEERKAFSKSYENEAGSAMKKALDAMQKEMNNTSWDWSHPFKSLKSMFSGDWSWKAQYASFDVGTNYVPNDGFAYIHKGEAIIPADQNVFADQGKAFSMNNVMNARLLSAIERLDTQLSQGINVNGEFRQRGNDLVAVVNKNKSQTGADLLSNVAYAR